jgi:hypothetical protein
MVIGESTFILSVETLISDNEGEADADDIEGCGEAESEPMESEKILFE